MLILRTFRIIHIIITKKWVVKHIIQRKMNIKKCILCKFWHFPTYRINIYLSIISVS